MGSVSQSCAWDGLSQGQWAAPTSSPFQACSFAEAGAQLPTLPAGDCFSLPCPTELIGYLWGEMLPLRALEGGWEAVTLRSVGGHD